MTQRLYHMYMKDGDGWQKIPGVYDDDEKKVMLRASWETGLSPKFELIRDSESSDSAAGTESDVESIQHSVDAN